MQKKLFSTEHNNQSETFLKSARIKLRMKLKEYFIDDGNRTDLSKMQANFISPEQYAFAHASLPIACHDIFIEHNGGLLMIVRDKEPMKGKLWVIGGRIERGLTTEESVIKKAKKECNLDLYDLQYLGAARIFLSSEPFDHGGGTDNPVFLYFARGKGELKLDNLHKDTLIVKPNDYSDIRKQLHSYIRDFMDKAIKMI